MKSRRKRALARGAALCALVCLPAACEARSVVLGADPLEIASAAGSGAIGGDAAGTGGSAAGSAGLAGAAGTVVIGGTGGFDPYPPVSWDDGQGYRSACPQWDDGTWGFTCWNVVADSRTCQPDGGPDCNACSCAVPCDVGSDCPSGVTGHPADCLDSEVTVPSCFLVCDDGICPAGMTCAAYPGVEREVCMWITDDGMIGPVR